MKKILDEIKEDDALEILKRIYSENKDVAKRIEEIGLEIIKDIDIDSVSESVFCDLDSLDLDELYKNSGRTRYGYVDPNEEAWEMFERALEPHIEEMKKLKKLKLNVQANKYCKGIIKGLNKFKEKATSEFSDWVEDAPGESTTGVLEEWKKGCKNKKEIKEMGDFIKKYEL